MNEDMKERWRRLPRQIKDKKIYCDVCKEVRPKKGKRTVNLDNDTNIMSCYLCIKSKRLLVHVNILKLKILDTDILEMLGIRKVKTKPQPKNTIAGISINPYSMQVDPKIKELLEKKHKGRKTK